ncbi:MAG: cobyrinate a,c-diamide synthase [Betaproteobacteria bacterium]|nr:cobyrinate a,c-diamide synthase [Betaproteobacteria bacterium]
MHRFLISAAHKSSGKTTISIGLTAALKARGHGIQTFKKGPDYIDPLWLGLAAGRACRNLDFYLSPHDELKTQFARYGSLGNTDVCLIEGNKGLYDGLDLEGSNSNAALARLLDLPVILVLDARGMTRGIAPLILGYQAFDRELNIAGVILNQLGGSRHEAKLRAVIEHYTDVPVVGAVHADPRLKLAERHLGLMPANETSTAARRITEIADLVAAQVNLDRLLELTATQSVLAPPLPVRVSGKPSTPNTPPAPAIRIAIARDAAFGFYYADDLDAFAAAGAELAPFDTLHDARLPNADGLFIGGGFPECFLDALEANTSLRSDIHAAIEAGLPAYVECGGLMYLARSISWQGSTRKMVGVIPADIIMHDKPVGRGYVKLAPADAHPWLDLPAGDTPATPEIDPAAPIAAHEFHYSSVSNLPPQTRYAYRMQRGYGIDGKNDGIIYRNLLASYTHLRSTPAYDWATRFVQFVQFVRSQRKQPTQPPIEEIKPCPPRLP